MRLYATTTSERASKGQGGNKFIELRVNVGDKDNSERILYGRVDARDEGYHVLITMQNDNGEHERIADTIIKGKRQKSDSDFETRLTNSKEWDMH